MMKQRNIPSLQYKKGEQIKATDVNDRFKLVFKEFNDMGASDVEPVTTGQFRVFEPSIGLKIEARLTTAADWQHGNTPATGANTFTVAAGVTDWYYVADGFAAVYEFLQLGHRYIVYANITTAVGTGSVGLYNGATMINPICVRSGGPTTGYALFGGFTAVTKRLCIGGTSTAGNMAVTLNPVTNFDISDKAIYIFDCSLNEWIIPNYCGWQYPVSSLSVIAGERREAHLLLEKAIKKEIDATNEVLRYI